MHAMPTFAVVTAKGPAWDHRVGIRQQAGWDEHAAFADRMVERGTTVVGGPITTGDPEVVALLLVNGDDETEVRSAFSADPWVGTHLLVYRSVYPWSLWLDSR